MTARRNDHRQKGSLPVSAAALQQHLAKKFSLEASKPNLNRSNKSLKERAKQSKQKDVVKKGNAESGYIGVEKVLEPFRNRLSLAQRLGILDAPESPLSEDEWKNIKLKSNDRQDSANPCAICQEPFAFEAQVLLSCSHVFHHVCLKSFEKLSGKKSCPMCRKQEYQSRLIFEGAKIHLDRAATRLQACWRGYVVRRMYKRFRAMNPPKDKRLRKTFYEAELSKLTDKFLHSVEKCSREVDVLMNEIDSDLEYSRRILRSLEINQKELQIDWESVQAKALHMDLRECPICLTSLGEPGKALKERPIALLSCAHLFHDVCLQTYEECNLVTKHQCPVCRSSYTKKKFPVT
ncbi:RING finger protein 32-like [Rhopilema esculentum]|uniref:RING finger protein 32-like n=1 Tax=Rhopilema esculentum TaxID=499914 RepID=UPI0031E28116|eukprot:gene14533-5599_t